MAQQISNSYRPIKNQGRKGWKGKLERKLRNADRQALKRDSQLSLKTGVLPVVKSIKRLLNSETE
jgi:hypothetical protein